jgi:hypothetical protein
MSRANSSPGSRPTASPSPAATNPVALHAQAARPLPNRCGRPHQPSQARLAQRRPRPLARRRTRIRCDTRRWRLVPLLRRLRRFAPGRVDCQERPDSHHCARSLTLRLTARGSLAWGTYRCPVGRSRGRVAPLRRLRPTDYFCTAGELSWPPPLFGRIADRWLVPWG